MADSKGNSGNSQVGGEIILDDGVIQTIAGLAAQQVEGLHSIGKPRIFGIGDDDPTRGVDAEVGKKQAAIDLDVIIEYGYDMKKVARTVRQTIAQEIERMAAREVVEVNINVIDIRLPEETQQKEAPRVE
jgi:uncharacterized alkaline shock family protein YloU